MHHWTNYSSAHCWRGVIYNLCLNKCMTIFNYICLIFYQCILSWVHWRFFRRCGAEIIHPIVTGQLTTLFWKKNYIRREDPNIYKSRFCSRYVHNTRIRLILSGFANILIHWGWNKMVDIFAGVFKLIYLFENCRIRITISLPFFPGFNEEP